VSSTTRDPDPQPERQTWLVSAICADCLTSDTGRAILTGAVGVARVHAGPVERCVLCGWPLADPAERFT
jgi:hypothetical protein